MNKSLTIAAFAALTANAAKLTAANQPEGTDNIPDDIPPVINAPPDFDHLPDVEGLTEIVVEEEFEPEDVVDFVTSDEFVGDIGNVFDSGLAGGTASMGTWNDGTYCNYEY